MRLGKIRIGDKPVRQMSSVVVVGIADTSKVTLELILGDGAITVCVDPFEPCLMMTLSESQIWSVLNKLRVEGNTLLEADGAVLVKIESVPDVFNDVI